MIRLMVLSACLWLTGCVGNALQSNKAVPTYYVMQPASLTQLPSRLNAATISVSKPILASGLDTSRIAVIEHGRTLKYISGAEYADHIGKVLTRLMVDSLNTHPAITALSYDEYNVKPDIRLVSHISAMQAEYRDSAVSGLPSAHIHAELWLIDYQSADVIAQHVITSQHALETNSTSAIIAEYERVWHEGLATLLTHYADAALNTSE